MSDAFAFVEDVAKAAGCLIIVIGLIIGLVIGVVAGYAFFH